MTLRSIVKRVVEQSTLKSVSQALRRVSATLADLEKELLETEDTYEMSATVKDLKRIVDENVRILEGA